MRAEIESVEQNLIARLALCPIILTNPIFRNEGIMTTCTEEERVQRLMQIEAKANRQCEDRDLECKEVSQRLDELQPLIKSLTAVCRQATAELNALAHCEGLEATLHMAESSAEVIGTLRDSLSSLANQISEVRQACASDIYDRHTSVMPLLSQEEIDHINGVNMFIPRASI